MLCNPHIGLQKRNPNRLRLLLVAFFDPAGIITVRENIGSWQLLSRFNIEVLNLWPGNQSYLAMPATININGYDGLILHSTVSHPDNFTSLDRHMSCPFSAFNGVKILAKQNEHYRASEVADFIKNSKFDLLLTSVPYEELNKVYPKSMVGECRFFHTLTGYVSAGQRQIPYVPLANRSIDVGYRGSLQPLSFGRLGWEKFEIGQKFAAVAPKYGLTTDISSEWTARLNGAAWLDFLQHIKAVLGVESGSNVFDFDGSLAARCADFERDNAGLPPNILYQRGQEEIIGKAEGNVNYAQISPRHFEAAATYTLQIMYEGEYSGIFIPWRHYLPLRRDFTNLPEIIEFLRNEERSTDMIQAARREIIDTATNHYETFVTKVEDEIEALFRHKGTVAPYRIASANTDAGRLPTGRAIILAAHEPTLDPRVEWMASSLAEHYRVCELGTYVSTGQRQDIGVESLSEARTRVRVDLHSSLPKGLSPIASDDPILETARTVWDRLQLTQLGDASDIACEYGFHSEDEIARTRNLAKHFAAVAASFVATARRLGAADVYVAVDLSTLLAGVILAKENQSKLVYDSHEYWPFSIVSFSAAETQFWASIERVLVVDADLCVTVSPPLARALSSEYGVRFLSVHNAIPLAARIEAPPRPPLIEGPVDFLVQGQFAPQRGYEELIAAWPQTPERARLVLRGPDNVYKPQIEQAARATGLLGTRILFPRAVSEPELISTAATASVGVIPYKPVTAGYRYCCPNKLSQYMASGLPILCNETEFVGPFVKANQIGFACNFADMHALSDAVASLVEDMNLYLTSSRNSHRVFDQWFHWESVSSSFVKTVLESAPPIASAPEFEFNWVGSAEAAADTRHDAPEAPTTDNTDVADAAKILLDATIRYVRQYGILRSTWHLLSPKLRSQILKLLFP